MHPLLSGAIEDQAIGRVHRIGQTKPCLVIRYIVRGTIEERLHARQQAHKLRTKAALAEAHGGPRSVDEICLRTPTKRRKLASTTNCGDAVQSAADVRALFGLNKTDDTDVSAPHHEPSGPGGTRGAVRAATSVDDRSQMEGLHLELSPVYG